MSGRDAPKYDRRRGRHKKRRSAEVREWEAAHLPPPAPPWMQDATARMLEDLRRRLDPLA